MVAARDVLLTGVPCEQTFPVKSQTINIWGPVAMQSLLQLLSSETVAALRKNT